MSEPKDLDTLHERNHSFCSEIPGFQSYWDSTSLGAFKRCPRYYQMSIIEGYQAKKRPLALVFGIQYHKSLELYAKAVTSGKTHNEAVHVAVRHALRVHDKELDKNHEDYMSYMDRVTDCTTRNRENLVRAVIWYLDTYEHDVAEIYTLKNGKPAVELTFKMDFPMPENFPIPIMLCGHMDRVVNFAGNIYDMDHKTSAYQLTERYFGHYSPDNQVSLYTLATEVILGETAAGVIIDAVQLAVGFCRFSRRPIHRSKGQTREWVNDTQHWVQSALTCAEQKHWPMNDTACDKFGGCPFKGMCSVDPELRPRILKSDFTQRIWDPSKAR